MKLGIIGLAGVGKATIFEAVTRNPPQENESPQEDRIGTIRVPDIRVDFLSGIYKPRKTIYAQVEYYLPHQPAYRQGREETVWSTVRTCDSLLHVIKNFKEFEEDKTNPVEDFQNLDMEMIFADLLVVEKRLERLAADRKRGRDADPEEEELLQNCRKLLEENIPLRRDPDLAGAHKLKGFTFLSAKPMLVLFNNDDDDDSFPADAEKLLARETCMVARGRLEHELSQMAEEDAAEYLAEYNITQSAMDRVIQMSQDLLGLISFFTVGEDEVRAWTIKRETLAIDAADVIHSDIKKGFIRAEVLAYNDLLDAGSYKEARRKGTVRLEGRTYRVVDGDIIEFRFNV